MASTSYCDLSRAPSGPSMAVTSRWIDEQRERSPPIRAQSRAPSQMSGLDVAGLLNRLVDRQHDDLQQARTEAYQREHEARAEAKAEAVQHSNSENKRPKRKLYRLELRHINERRRPELKPISARRKPELRLISGKRS